MRQRSPRWVSALPQGAVTPRRRNSSACSDARRSAVFTKFGRLISIAARMGGPDPVMNFRLRLAIDKAKDGNGTALRICWDRIAPLPKKEPVGCDLPPLLEVSDAASFVAALITAVACGDLVAREGSDIAKLVDTYLRTLEVTDLEARVAKLAGTHARFDQRV